MWKNNSIKINTRKKLLSVAGKVIFSQLRPTLKKADYLYYEPDYLNHAQEIIFNFSGKQSDIYKGRRGKTHKLILLPETFCNFSLRPHPPPPCLRSNLRLIISLKWVRSMMQTTRKIGYWPRRVGL